MSIRYINSWVSKHYSFVHAHINVQLHITLQLILRDNYLIVKYIIIRMFVKFECFNRKTMPFCLISKVLYFIDFSSHSREVILFFLNIANFKSFYKHTYTFSNYLGKYFSF